MKNQHQERPSGRDLYIFQIMAILLVVLLSACSSGLTVRSEIDPGANFSQYRTYNFFDPMGIEGG
ncbi:MAG: DUF4136 domain-containing protein, partial [Gammaproteobacteria bacterium]|nr:DUF4136 domain-containing protein [Gammaproteobacteria bacterium]